MSTLRFRDSESSQRLGEDRFFFLWLSFVEVDEAGFLAEVVQVPKQVDSLVVVQRLKVKFATDELTTG